MTTKGDTIGNADTISLPTSQAGEVEVVAWPVGGYAPGDYSCLCLSCKASFIGDKRASQCLPCAVVALRSSHQSVIAAKDAELDHKERVIEGLNKQLTEQFELSTKYVALHQAAEARANAPVVTDGWQPIETAPRGGEYILLGNEHGAWVGKYQARYQSGHEPPNPWSSMMLNTRYMPHLASLVPSHWMPLPAPPATAALGGGE